ncbi:MAG: precorrin-6y C5,15-methyltransferase (decarboxylating) subunit CbiE [Clostridium sp.]|uniref:precorrin-6y C5,15-methyltransferase (decarboxylating) subunit CbiE n=1 Tax=Clostridium sp. TaxID=1506 RepID=UPI0030685802
MIYIVGIGPGSRDYILPKAIKVLERSDVIIGFSRALESVDFVAKNKIAVTGLAEILKVVEESNNENISIIASGDPCFYGVTDYIKRSLKGYEIEIIPGISSFQYLMSKIGKSWHGKFLGSVHGREEDFLNIVRSNNTCVFLTDGKNSPKMLAKKLFDEDIECRIWVGENLSYDDEKITTGNPKEIMSQDFSSLSVFVVEEN